MPVQQFLGSLSEPVLATVETQTQSTWPKDGEGWADSTHRPPLDLSMLWQVLEKHKKAMEEKDDAGENISTTWELVVVQGVILTVLILISIMWAVCCRKRCFSNDNSVTVAEALRKLSKDLPPSYSTRDLHTLGISVNDHLNPPPAYLDLFKDNLQYLDLEAGHARMAKLSFCSAEGGSSPRLARLSVASCASCSSESPVIVPIQKRESKSSLSSTTSTIPGISPRNSRTSSRVSFSEDVETSNGSIRRLSSNSQLGNGSGFNSRKSSSSSDGSRKSSLITKVNEVKRKLGSNSSINSDSFINQLDEDLRQKLEKIGDTEDSDPEAERKAERQAERAARVCDIIHEEKH